MKNIKNSGLLYTIFTIIGSLGLIGIWIGVYSMFVTLTNDEVRSAVVATSYAVALLDSALFIFKADDDRTFRLSIGMSIGYLAIGIVAIVGNASYRAASGQIDSIAEPLAWTIPFTWLIPVLNGMASFILRSCDRLWGVDKEPVVNGGTSDFVVRLNWFTGGATMFFALLGSAFGTYEVTYTITQSFYASMIYVGTVEAAIFAFAKMTDSTEDIDVFYWTFGVTILYFILAIVIQMVDAFSQLWAVDAAKNTYIQFLSKEFVLLPPIITIGVGGALLVYNQRKTGRLMGNAKGSSFNRLNRQPQMPQMPQRNQPQQQPQRQPQQPPQRPYQQNDGQGRQSQMPPQQESKRPTPTSPDEETIDFDEILKRKLAKDPN